MQNGITHNNLGVKNLDSLLPSIKNLEEVYVCFDFSCNLNCPHCTLQKIKMKKNLLAVKNTMEFISRVKPDIEFNFFGGEPLLLDDSELKLFDEFFDKHDIIISTNLLRITDYQLKLFQKAEDINTSWNPKRFSVNQYETWVKNLEILKANNIHYSIMITLTKDLIQDYTPEDFLLSTLTLGMKNLDLKLMIGDKSIDFSKIDSWLVELYKLSKNLQLSYTNLLFKEITNVARGGIVWKQMCPTLGTIYPNGNLKIGCPYYEYKTDKSKCFSCEYYQVCKGGCDIIDGCNFPKQLYEEVKKYV